MRILVILFGLMCLIIGRCSGKNWRTPAGVISIIWIGFCIVPSCILWTDIAWDYWGLLWIEASCFAFSLGQIIATADNWHIVVHESKNERNVLRSGKFILNKKLCKAIILCMLIVCAIHIVRNLINKGFSLSVFYNIGSLIDINNTAAYERYQGGNATTALNQIVLIIEYCLPLLGGFSFSFFRRKSEKILCSFTLFPVFIALLLSNAKAGFIASVMGFAISFMVGSYLANGTERNFSPKFIRNTMVLSACFFSVLFISMCLRVGSFDSSTVNYVKNRFMIYMFGQIKAFDEWMSENLFYKDLNFGTMTYNWFFNITGLVERKQGVYGYAQSIRTNVFTLFRGIVLDYGSIGGLVYSLVRGIVGGYIYKQVQKKEKVNPLLIVLLSTTYLFYFYGFIISPWTYTTYFAAYVVLFIVLVVCQTKKKENSNSGI